MIPAGVHALSEAGHQVFVQASAGDGSGIRDEEYSQAGAELVALDVAAETIEGTPPGPQTVILKFESPEAARAWYESEEYQAVVGKRLQALLQFFDVGQLGSPWLYRAIIARQRPRVPVAICFSTRTATSTKTRLVTATCPPACPGQ